ncbi:MAG: J domain-containing protein [Deltaproteobacteria bacterium]|jgi:molecular chaperone DnaJ|nr:J domain-containing protein [Deltaproteobacteria bacterium]
MSFDPYKTLGVDNKVSPEDLKKAYRTLARKYHPDVRPGDKEAEEKFKEISQAYDILSDKEKRAAYDSQGQDFFTGGASRGGNGGYQFDPGSFDFADILGDLFGGGGGGFDFGGMGGGRTFGQPRARRGDDVEQQVSVSFRDAVLGREMSIKVNAPATCPHCGGRGTLPGDGGRPKKCPACRGNGAVTTLQTIKTRVPAGFENGKKLKLKGKGGPGENGGRAGDLFLVVNVEPDPVFTRDAGLNLHEEMKLGLYDALLGATAEVETIGGKISLKIPAGTQNGARFKIKGKGVKTGEKTGDLYVTVKVVLPTKLSPEARELLEELREKAPVAAEGL